MFERVVNKSLNSKNARLEKTPDERRMICSGFTINKFKSFLKKIWWVYSNQSFCANRKSIQKCTRSSEMFHYSDKLCAKFAPVSKFYLPYIQNIEISMSIAIR